MRNAALRDPNPSGYSVMYLWVRKWARRMAESFLPVPEPPEKKGLRLRRRNVEVPCPTGVRLDTEDCGDMLRNLVPPDAELWCEPKCVVERGDSAEKILDVAGRTTADLIVLGVRKPGGVAGAATHLPIATAHKIVSHARCPVLTVRG